MLESRGPGRDLIGLVLPEVGRLVATGNRWEPHRLLDRDGSVVVPVTAYLADLQAANKSVSTMRSYGTDLLRWWRFLWVLGVEWDRASQVEARDFARWMLLADKPARVHWRRQQEGPSSERQSVSGHGGLEPGTPNLVTGKPSPGRKYAASTRAHAETVLRAFYAFHLSESTGPIINPFPLDHSRRAGRVNAHHNPMDSFRDERQGRYRPKVVKRIPRRIPDEMFDELFAKLKHDRDRALVAFWVSSGARAEELLSSLQRDARPGEQLIGVVRKGTRAYQQLPVSADAFVWLRLYQEQAWREGVPRGPGQPLWWTLRRPWRPLGYHAVRAMFDRANDLLGSNWTLHDLRHTASYRMAQDPQLPLPHVQWVLGHKYLTTTQIYLPAGQDEVVNAVIEHHARRDRQRAETVPVPPAPGYNTESLDVLFGHRS